MLCTWEGVWGVQGGEGGAPHCQVPVSLEATSLSYTHTDFAAAVISMAGAMPRLPSGYAWKGTV